MKVKQLLSCIVLLGSTIAVADWSQVASHVDGLSQCLDDDQMVFQNHDQYEDISCEMDHMNVGYTRFFSELISLFNSLTGQLSAEESANDQLSQETTSIIDELETELQDVQMETTSQIDDMQSVIDDLNLQLSQKSMIIDTNDQEVASLLIQLDDLKTKYQNIVGSRDQFFLMIDNFANKVRDHLEQTGDVAQSAGEVILGPEAMDDIGSEMDALVTCTMHDEPQNP